MEDKSKQVLEFVPLLSSLCTGVFDTTLIAGDNTDCEQIIEDVGNWTEWIQDHLETALDHLDERRIKEAAEHILSAYCWAAGTIPALTNSVPETIELPKVQDMYGKFAKLAGLHFVPTKK